MHKFFFYIVFIFGVIGCTKKENKSLGAKTLRYPLRAKLTSIDPGTTLDSVSADIIYQVYETLYQYHYLKRPFSLTPLLAEKMPYVSANGLEYTIQIKKNVPYHECAGVPSGRTVKADDFITALKRQAFTPTAGKGWWALEGQIEGLDDFRTKAGTNFESFKTLTVKGLQAADDYTLKITLTKINPRFNYILAMALSAPIPIEAIENNHNDLDLHEIGTGPYLVSEYKKDVLVKLKRFENYHPEFYPMEGDGFSKKSNLLEDAGKKLPFIDEIHFLTMIEPQTLWLNFLANKIDILEDIPKDNFSMVFSANGEINKEIRNKNIVIYKDSPLLQWWLSFNLRDETFSQDLNLRLAIAHAINRNELIQLFTNNTGVLANSIYPPGIFGYDPNKKNNFTYDLNKAKEYLAKSKYTPYKGPIINFDLRSTSSSIRQLGEFIQNELKIIGINIRVNLNSFPAFLDKSTKGNLQFWLDGWNLDYPDAENILMLLTEKNFPPGNNNNYFNNPIFERKYSELSLLNDDDKKIKLMKEMEAIVEEEMPWVMLYYPNEYVLAYDKVLNYRPSNFIRNTLKYLKIK